MHETQIRFENTCIRMDVFIQWHPQLIRHNTNLRTYYRTGPVPFGIARVLMSRPISPELVLSPDLWISNTPRYFSFAPLIPILTLLPNFGGFHRTLHWVRLANRGRLLLRTPGPVPFGIAFVLMLRPFFPELVMSMDLLSFEHPSVLLFCFINIPRAYSKFNCPEECYISDWSYTAMWPLSTLIYGTCSMNGSYMYH